MVMSLYLHGNLLPGIFKVTYLSPKIEKLKASIDSFWYYKIQLNYSSWEIRKLKGLLFSIFFQGFKILILNA